MGIIYKKINNEFSSSDSFLNITSSNNIIFKSSSIKFSGSVNFTGSLNFFSENLLFGKYTLNKINSSYINNNIINTGYKNVLFYNEVSNSLVFYGTSSNNIYLSNNNIMIYTGSQTSKIIIENNTKNLIKEVLNSGSNIESSNYIINDRNFFNNKIYKIEIYGFDIFHLDGLSQDYINHINIYVTSSNVKKDIFLESNSIYFNRLSTTVTEKNYFLDIHFSFYNYSYVNLTSSFTSSCLINYYLYDDKYDGDKGNGYFKVYNKINNNNIQINDDNLPLSFSIDLRSFNGNISAIGSLYIQKFSIKQIF